VLVLAALDCQPVEVEPLPALPWSPRYAFVEHLSLDYRPVDVEPLSSPRPPDPHIGHEHSSLVEFVVADLE